MIEAVGAFIAWLGASLVVLSDGRRGLALGAALAGAGVGLAALSSVGLAGAVALGVGGVIAGGGRSMTGPAGWGIMPAGSTPRLVLCVAGGFVALWGAAIAMTGDHAGLRFAVVALIGLSGARVLQTGDRPTLLTAAGLIALGVGAGAGAGTESPSIAPYVLAGAIAAALAWLPSGARSAA